MASSASSASSLNFTTRQLDVQLDTQEFQVNLERFQQLIESGLSIMFSKDSLALHLNEPLEAQNRAEQLKALSFQGRDPMVEEPSGIDNPPSTITWMELIHEVQSHKFKPDLTCNVVYGCHYKGKIIKILEKDKKKIEELQVLSTEKLAFQHDIVKERKVAAEMLSRVNNVAETFQRITEAIDEFKRQLGGRIRLCQNEPPTVDTDSNANDTSGPADDSIISNLGEDVSESTQTLQNRRMLRLKLTNSMAQSRNNSISSPRTRHSSIEVSTEGNPIPRTAEELASAVGFLDAARQAGRPWPEVADKYAERFRVKRSANFLSLYLNKDRAPLRKTMSVIPVSTNRKSIPLGRKEKKEGGKFVDDAFSAVHDWEKVRHDYALKFGVCRAKNALGHLRSKYLRSLANSDCDETRSRSSEMTSDVSTDSILAGMSRTIADSEEETHWIERQEDSADEGNIEEEEDTPMVDSMIHHPHAV